MYNIIINVDALYQSWLRTNLHPHSLGRFQAKITINRKEKAAN